MATAEMLELMTTDNLAGGLILGILRNSCTEGCRQAVARPKRSCLRTAATPSGPLRQRARPWPRNEQRFRRDHRSRSRTTVQAPTSPITATQDSPKALDRPPATVPEVPELIVEVRYGEQWVV